MLNKLKQGIRTHHNKHMNVEISVERGQGKKKKLKQLWEAQSRKLLTEVQTTGGKHRGNPPRLYDFYFQELYSVSKMCIRETSFHALGSSRGRVTIGKCQSIPFTNGCLTMTNDFLQV